MRVLSRLLVVCLCLGSLPTMAQTLGTLYQVREPVSSQQPEERDAALRRALDVLIVRLTGDESAPQNPALAALRADPQQVIGTYGYEGGETQSLLVQFDSAASERAVRQAGLSLWGSNRPKVLVWWFSDATAGNNLIGDGQSGAEMLRRAAQYRGLPLQLPLADLQEQLLATAQLLETEQLDGLRSASERYAADALLAVHAREEAEKWQAQWHLRLGDDQEQGTASGASQAELADAVMLAVAGRLAPRFVVAGGAAEALMLIIEGADLGRYAELQQLLAGFDARLRSIDGDRLTYQVSTGADQLRVQLGLLHLQEVPAEPAAGGVGEAPAPQGRVMRYRW